MRFLNKERSGASTFEWTVTLPFTITIIFVVFFIFMILLSWISYGSVASNIAKDLNIRGTGLIQANNYMSSYGSNTILKGRTATDYEYTITRDQVRVNHLNSGDEVLNSYKNAVMYHMKEYANQFFFPYTKFEDINVDILQSNDDGSYTRTFDTESALSNYLIKVDIRYKFMPIQIMELTGQPGVDLYASGYGIVT